MTGFSRPDLAELADVAEQAARAAGEAIRGASRQDRSASWKRGGSSIASQIVTATDRIAQELILEILAPATHRFRLATLAEEAPDDGTRFEQEAFWCIDPLDGTLFFAEGVPGHAVSIALVSRAGRPLLGVVFDPTEGVLYRAIRGGELSRDGRAWSPLEDSAIDTGSRSLVFHFDRSFADSPDEARVLAGLESLAEDLGCSELRTATRGGAVMNAVLLLESPPACYFKFPKAETGGGSLWDFAATSCILREAGAVALDWEGNPLDLNRPGSTYLNTTGSVLATSEALADEILRRF